MSSETCQKLKTNLLDIEVLPRIIPDWVMILTTAVLLIMTIAVIY